MFTCNVSADLFRRAMAFISTDETRYYLQGVKVEPCPDGGVIMVSTDGAAMVVVRDPEGQCSGSAVVKLSPDTAKALKVASYKTPRFLVITDGQARVLAGVSDSQTVIHIQAAPALIDAHYPNWRSVIPAPDISVPSLPATFQGKRIERMAATLSGDCPAPAVVLYGAGPIEPHLAFGVDPIEAFGVLMPIRNVKAARSVDWARTIPKADAIAAE